MLFSWPARIVSHVGELAVVQVPGGLFLVNDARGDLRDGDEAEVRATDPGHTLAAAALLGSYSVEQQGQLAILRTGDAVPQSTVALLMRAGETLPAAFVLSIPPDDAPAVDDDAQAKPFGDPPSNCCPDCVPDQIDHLLPCCCVDIDPLSIDALLPTAPATPFPGDLLSFLDELLSPLTESAP